MKKKRKISIKYTKARTILSDVLPYEIPVIFSNRHFYRFLNNFEPNISKKLVSIEKNKENKVAAELANLIFGEDHTTIPFLYNITHKGDDFRQLTLIHPRNQVAVIDFYEEYKDLLLYYCSISPFSIRYPERVAKLTYFRDKVHQENLSTEHEHELLEERNREYENLKTFFVYKNYSNIHRFYESFKYHRCEKKYNRLVKFDIQKCFESIYTHSICWATLNKKIVKDNLGNNKTENTFGGKFDRLMQNLNYSETNGIVIGPEFSRIFSEIILQKIDKDVLAALEESTNLKHKVDFEIFRYVDDYFLFYNKEEDREIIMTIFKLNLKEYKLQISREKTEIYDKPIITLITIAKQQIRDLLNEYLSFSLDEKDDPNKKISIYVSSNALITKFKTILKQTEVEYKDILNYTLAIIDRKIVKILKDFKENKFEEKKLINALFEILEFTFFVYSVFPKVNTTVKLCHILSKITNFISKNPKKINIDHAHLLKKKIFDEAYLVLKKNKTKSHIQIETLYLLIVLQELGKEYLLDQEVLRDYFNPDQKKNWEEVDLEYFSIVVLLFYIKNKKRYEDLKNQLRVIILEKFKKSNVTDRHKKSELVLLLLDLLSCPYLEESFKKELLELRKITNNQTKEQIIAWGKKEKENRYWFVKWEGFNLEKELDAKKGQEVY